MKSNVVDIASLLEKASMQEFQRSRSASSQKRQTELFDVPSARAQQQQLQQVEPLLDRCQAIQSQEVSQSWSAATSTSTSGGGVAAPMYPTQLASPLPTASLAQQVGDLQQLCHRQQWQTNAEKVLDELQEAKASMALQQDLLENLIGELKGLVPALAKAQGGDPGVAQLMQQIGVMLVDTQVKLQGLSAPNRESEKKLEMQLQRLDTNKKLECTKNELIAHVQRVVEEANGKLLTSVSDMMQRQREEKMAELVRAEVSRIKSEKIVAPSAALADSETQIEMGAALSEDSALDDLDIFACGGTDEKKKKKKKTKKRKAETKQEKSLDTSDYMEKVRNKILNARKKKKRDNDLHDSAL